MGGWVGGWVGRFLQLSHVVTDTPFHDVQTLTFDSDKVGSGELSDEAGRKLLSTASQHVRTELT